MRYIQEHTIHTNTIGMSYKYQKSASLDIGDDVAVKFKLKENIYRNSILHSSQLDCSEAVIFCDRTVIVIGSGAIGVEVVETMLSRGASNCIMLARNDKVAYLAECLCQLPGL